MGKSKKRSRKESASSSDSSESSTSSSSGDEELDYSEHSDRGNVSEGDAGEPAAFKIPRKSDYVNAQEAVPSPPKVSGKKYFFLTVFIRKRGGATPGKNI